MGWLFSHHNKSNLIQELVDNRSSDSHNRIVLEHALIDDVLWSVVRLELKQANLIQGNAPGDTYTFIACDLIDIRQGLWGNKSLSEAVHPFYYTCPLHFLEMAPNGINPEWREAVHRHHSDNAA